MGESATFLVCTELTSAHWRLGPLPVTEGRLLLIAWVLASRRNDAGVPHTIAEVLCRAWTASHGVTFPFSSTVSVYPNEGVVDDKVWTIKCHVMDHLAACLRSAPSDIPMLSTQWHPSAMQLFEDTAFPWHFQGQLALLGNGELIASRLTRPQLLSLMDEDWVMHAQMLAGSGIQAVLRPGVDGNVIGLWSVTGQVQESLMQAMETAAQRAGIGWRRVNEDELMAQLAQH